MRPHSRDVNLLECFISVLYFDLPVTPPHAVHWLPPSLGAWKRPVNSVSLTMFISPPHSFWSVQINTSWSLNAEKQWQPWPEFIGFTEIHCLSFSSSSTLIPCVCGVAFECLCSSPPMWEQQGSVARGVAPSLTLQVFALPCVFSVHTLIPQDPPCALSPLERSSFYLSGELTESLWRFWSECTPLSNCVCTSPEVCQNYGKQCLLVVTTSTAKPERLSAATLSHLPVLWDGCKCPYTFMSNASLGYEFIKAECTDLSYSESLKCIKNSCASSNIHIHKHYREAWKAWKAGFIVCSWVFSVRMREEKEVVQFWGGLSGNVSELIENESSLGGMRLCTSD